MPHPTRLLFLFVILPFLLNAGAPEEGMTLPQCYQQAFQQNEILKRQQEAVNQSQAQARAALGGAFPRLTWDWRDTWQDTSGTAGGPLGSFFDNNQVESKFSLEQPLFTGLREFSAWAGFNKQTERDQWRLRFAELSLYEEVSAAFFEVRALETSLENSKISLTLAQERVEELKSFYRLGKAREGEIFSSESQVAVVKATQVHLKGQIRMARERLSFLMGIDVGESPLVDPPAETPAPSLETFLSRAADRSDIKAQRLDVLGQTLRVRYEKGSYWPTARLTGNYYTQRPEFYEPVDWDVMLNLNVPLFQGGTVTARVNEARSILEQSRQTLAHLERDVRSQVKRAYIYWRSSLEEDQSLENAYRAAKKSYEAQLKEYRLGLVTNLDVNNALALMQTAKRAWDETRVETKRRYITLTLATGVLP